MHVDRWSNASSGYTVLKQANKRIAQHTNPSLRNVRPGVLRPALQTGRHTQNGAADQLLFFFYNTTAEGARATANQLLVQTVD